MLRSIAFTAIMVPFLLVAASGKPFLGVLLWSWISFMSPHRLIHGFASHQPWAMVTFLATVIGCVLAREPKRVPRDAATLLLVLFAIGITITSILAISPPDVVWKRYDKVIKILAGVLLTRALLTDADRIHALLWMMVIGLGYYGVRGGAFTLMTGGVHKVLGPADSMIADRNHVAVAFLFAIPLMNHLRLQSKHAWVRTGLIVAMVLSAFAAIGTQSRGALVAFAAAGSVMWWRSRGKIFSAIAIAAIGALVITFMPESWEERMRTIVNYEDDLSALGRVRIWEASWKIALARPLFGAGFQGMYHQWIVDRYAPGITARAAHSIWFETLGEHGFIVFAIWLGIMVAGWVYAGRLVRLGRRDARLAWVNTLGRMSQVSFIAYMAGGTFLSLQYWDCYLTMVSLLAAAYELATAEAPLPAGLPQWRVAARGAVAPAWRGRAEPAPAGRVAAASWRTRASR